MKKLIFLVLFAALLAPVPTQAKTPLEKALKKEYKQKMKEYKKEKWKLFGSSRSLDVALLRHYDRLNELGEDGREIVGVSSRTKSKNIGKQMAYNNACLTYAQQAGSSVKGRVISDLSGDGVDAVAEMDHFYSAYERLVEKNIKGEMEESYSIIHDNGDGTFEIQTFFIVSESAASKARIRAMEDAMKESEAAQKHAAKISSFVREGFEQ